MNIASIQIEALRKALLETLSAVNELRGNKTIESDAEVQKCIHNALEELRKV